MKTTCTRDRGHTDKSRFALSGTPLASIHLGACHPRFRALSHVQLMSQSLRARMAKLIMKFGDSTNSLCVKLGGQLLDSLFVFINWRVVDRIDRITPLKVNRESFWAVTETNTCEHWVEVPTDTFRTLLANQRLSLPQGVQPSTRDTNETRSDRVVHVSNTCTQNQSHEPTTVSWSGYGKLCCVVIPDVRLPIDIAHI